MEPRIIRAREAESETPGRCIERYSIASPNRIAYSFANDAIVTPKPWPMPGLFYAPTKVLTFRSFEHAHNQGCGA